jgi:hypothetical protein
MDSYVQNFLKAYGYASVKQTHMFIYSAKHSCPFSVGCIRLDSHGIRTERPSGDK